MSRRTKLKRQALAAIIPADMGEVRIFNTKRKIAIEVMSQQGTSRVNLDKEAVKAVQRRLTALVRDKVVWKDPPPPVEIPKRVNILRPPKRVKLANEPPKRLKLPKHLLDLLPGPGSSRFGAPLLFPIGPRRRGPR